MAEGKTDFYSAKPGRLFLLLIIPEQYDGLLVHILGYAALLLGGVMVWDFIGGSRKLKDFILFVAALLLMVLGIFVLVSGDNTLVVLSVFFGILLIIDGLHSAVHAWMYARRAGKNGGGFCCFFACC